MPSWQVSLMKQNQGFAWPQLNVTCSKIQHIYIFTSIHICSYLVSLTSNSISSLRKRENWSGNRTSKGCIEEPSVTWKLLRGLEITNYGASCIYMIYCILYIYIYVAHLIFKWINICKKEKNPSQDTQVTQEYSTSLTTKVSQWPLHFSYHLISHVHQPWTQHCNRPAGTCPGAL